LTLLGLAVLLGVLLLLADRWVSWRASAWIARDLAAVEPTPVALVLGTARRTLQGRPNQFYRTRLEAAAALYHQGRVKGILVSGDNATRYYNEPEAMRRDLIALGVPDAHVTLDYAGFRTLDSVVRAWKVFGLDEFLIVSQSYHAERGVFIARHYGLNARGYAAADPGGAGGFKVRLREVGARAMAIWDLLSGRSPKFLGEPEPVKVRGEAQPTPSAGVAEEGGQET
jgi:SanA protein